MTSLYIDKKGLELEVQGQALILREQGIKVGNIPLGLIERIFLRGEVTFPARLLAKLGELKIGLVLLAGWQNQATLFLPRAHHDAQRRLLQYHHYLEHPYRMQEARYVVSEKLQAQISVIEKNMQQLPKARYALHHALEQLREMQNHMPTTDEHTALLGFEGSSARIYFTGLASMFPQWANFQGRNRRPPRDPANALMSLAYTLMHAEAVLVAYEFGLDPDIGMLHSLCVGRESLACDQIEALRPMIDDWLATQMRQECFCEDDFSHTHDACLLQKAGRMRFYAEWEKVMPTWRKQLRSQLQQLLNRIEQRPCAI